MNSNTTSHINNFEPSKYNSNLAANSVLYGYIALWNRVPDQIINCANSLITLFKILAEKYLFDHDNIYVKTLLK